MTTSIDPPRRALAGPGARGSATRLAGVALGLLLSATIAGTAAGAEVVLTADAVGSAGGVDVAPGAKAVPAPPSKPEPKPKRHDKVDPIVDEEPDPPGPGDRIVVTKALNLFRAAGFRYQDPNYYACTATSVMDMLNFVAIAGSGGSGFRWSVRLTATQRDAILAWERVHDTLAGGNGSDPHGWRNALNYYGWGSSALYATGRIYEDYAYSSYAGAMKAAIRSMIRFHKPVGIAAWRGQHAQMITGYDGLVGDPFAVDSTGRYTNTFTVAAVYLTDPLAADAAVNRRIGYATLANTANTRLRFSAYFETDSPYDDPYTTGWIRARNEWYGRWVIVAAKR